MRAERRINSLRRTSIATVEQGRGGRLRLHSDQPDDRRRIVAQGVEIARGPGVEPHVLAAVRGALMLVAQAAQPQRGGSGEAILATRLRAAFSAMQATVLSLYFLILSRVLR